MAEVKEDPTVEPVEPGTPPETVVPEPTPEPTPVSPLAGTPFEGKTPEELAKMVTDKEAFIKDRSDELGQLRNENAYFRSIQQQPEQKPQQPDYEDMDQRFLTNPAKTTMSMMDERFNKYGMQAQYQQAQMMAPMVEQQATGAYPIFKDLDETQRGEVRRYMLATTDPRSGMNPNYALSAEAWANAASMVYMKSRGYKPVSTPVNPVAPVVTETPQATKPKGEASFLDSVPQKYRTMWSESGFTPEQQEKMAKDISEGEE